MIQVNILKRLKIILRKLIQLTDNNMNMVVVVTIGLDKKMNNLCAIIKETENNFNKSTILAESGEKHLFWSRLGV